MKKRAKQELLLDVTSRNRLPSIFLLSALISIQSLILFPSSGQNGISICQSEKVHTEVLAKQNTKRQISFSFIKLFLQLNNLNSETGQRLESWIQSRLNYSMLVEQRIRFLELHCTPRFPVIKSNTPHSNLDEYHIEHLS
jgi:hypothetical protein